MYICFFLSLKLLLRSFTSLVNIDVVYGLRCSMGDGYDGYFQGPQTIGTLL